MKLTRPDNQQTGMTMIELVCVIAVLAILTGLLLPAGHGCKEKAPMTACVNNLRQVTLGQLIWVNDHPSTNHPASDGGFGRLLTPDDIASYYKTLSNELLSPKILTCPSDTRKPVDDFRSLTTNHLSYFLNMDARSATETETAINGDRHISFTPLPLGQTVTLTPNLSMQWTKKLGHGDVGNVALVDGSAQKTSSRDLTLILLPRSNTVPQRLLFP